MMQFQTVNGITQPNQDTSSLLFIFFAGGLFRFTFRRFLEDCYSENRRRMGVFDKELLRPSFLPQLAETALGAMRLWSFRAKPLPA